ncbi:DoxX family protein [Streptomyces sp. NPDC054841]
MSSFEPLALAIFLCLTGIAHFAVPRYFRTLVPRWLPAPGALVAVTGVMELAAAALLAVPGTRAAGGWTAAALIAAFLTSHVDAVRHACHARHARRSRPRLLDRPAGVALRIVVNLGYLAWAVAVARA